MKICIISKYPPIEGGVSARTYWLAKALGEEGHKVHIVTNAWEVEENYRAELSKEDIKNIEPENVSLFSTNPKSVPAFIPYHNPFVTKLTSLALQVIKEHDTNIIYAYYLLPYGVSALFAKLLLKKPLIVRHAGSDITRLFDNQFLKPVFLEVFKNADMIIGNKNTQKRLSPFKTGRIVQVNEAVNTYEFNPEVKPFDLSKYTNLKTTDKPVLTYFGKVSELKKVYSFVNAASKIKKLDFLLLFVTGNGPKAEYLKDYVRQSGLLEKSVFLPFQPPWKMPSILTLSTCVVCPESKEEPYLPEGTHSPQKARESFACGRCTIIGEDVSKKRVYSQLSDGLNTLIVNPEDINDFSAKLEMVIKDPEKAETIGKNAREFSEKTENFKEYTQNMLRIFKSWNSP